MVSGAKVAVRRFWTGVTGISVTLVVLLLCFVYFALRIATRSHPEPFRESTAFVKDSTRVYRNAFGIPHIIGKNTHDVFFAQGYVHAQDRLWQMDLWRRTGRGRTAEIFGKEGVAIDAFLRSLEIRAIAARQARSISKRSREILQAYADGVNAYIDENNEDLPFEFDALDYKPEPWTIEDCLIVGRVLSFELSLAFWTDLAFAQIDHAKGQGTYKRYVPRSNRGPFVLDTTQSSVSRDTTSLASVVDDATDKPLMQEGHAQSLIATLQSVRAMLGLQGSGYGSNCWAVRTPDGSAIVANDPHMSVSVPAKWYEIHLSAPKLNVVGLSIPGLPLVFSGRNDHLAWGFTNVMADDMDYVLQRLDAKDPVNYYLDGNGARRKFTYKDDTIKVKGTADTIIAIRYTNISSVLSDHHLSRHPEIITGFDRPSSTGYLRGEQRKQNPTCLTFRWTAQYASDEVLAMYLINTASTSSKVISALSSWGSPALNFTVGTRTGTVVNVAAGYAPKRGSSDPHVPITNVYNGGDWSGVWQLTSLGALENPRQGWVGTANNPTSPTAPYITSLYEPNSRIVRLKELMSLYKNPSVRDIQMVQQDLQSPYAKSMLKKILPALESYYKKYTSEQKRALSLLQKWDGTFSPIDKGASIYAIFLQRLIWSTFVDELGKPLYYDYVHLSNLPLRRIEELIDQPTDTLWDDVRTRSREQMSWIVIRAFMYAVKDLEVHLGPDNEANADAWQWGKLHTIAFPHVFGRNPLMQPVMNLGPFAVGGAQTTLNNSEWDVATQDSTEVFLPTRVSPSMRVISHVGDSVQYVVVPGGSSGQPLNRHYSDQMQLWLKGGYVKVPVKPTADITFQLYHVFTPR